MAEVLLSTLLPQVTPYLTKPESPVTLQALRNAARLFCQDTNAWRAILTTITIAVDDDTYTISVPSGYTGVADIVEVFKVRTDKTSITKTSPILPPSRWTFGTDNVLTLTETPSAAGVMEVTVVLKPRPLCTQLPDWFVSRWTVGLTSGALMLLKGQKNRPWSDPDGAAEHFGLYRQEVYEAKRENIKLRQGGTLVMASPGVF